MFSFLQTIINKVTTVMATAAIALGFMAAPEPPTQPVLDSPKTAIEQQINKSEIENQSKQSEVNNSSETEKLKKEIDELRKSINKQTPPPAVVDLPVQQSPIQTPQLQKTVPPRPENSDDWIFNWDAWAWEKHPSQPPQAPTINLPQQNNNDPYATKLEEFRGLSLSFYTDYSNRIRLIYNQIEVYSQQREQELSAVRKSPIPMPFLANSESEVHQKYDALVSPLYDKAKLISAEYEQKVAELSRIYGFYPVYPKLP